MLDVPTALLRGRTRIRSWRGDLRGISGIGALGLGGAGLALTIAALAMTQADLLAGQVEPITREVIDDGALDLRVGEIMGRVDRFGASPAVSEIVLSASIGPGTERVDVRTLTIRLTGDQAPVVLAHPETNGTLQDGVFTTRLVRDTDGSMREFRVGEGDRLDLIVNLTDVAAELGPGEQLVLYFHTEGGTSMRVHVDAPRTFGLTDWVRMEGEVKRGA